MGVQRHVEGITEPGERAVERHVCDRVWEAASTTWGTRRGLGGAAWSLGVLAALEDWD